MSTRWVPYLVMDGNAGEAADFYAKTLGGEVVGRMTFGDMPEGPQDPVPEETKSRITHVRVGSGPQGLMLSDTFPGMPYRIGNPITIPIGLDDAARARHLRSAGRRRNDRHAAAGDVLQPRFTGR
ncbi:VOC family protein [Saccharibacillus deserti]|uniref:VOC family protein n=1 Tax=Saccharibacillus deserti TaxID=1634444 RepID=UPI0031B5EF6A